jgi:hypothetical protein
MNKLFILLLLLAACSFETEKHLKQCNHNFDAMKGYLYASYDREDYYRKLYDESNADLVACESRARDEDGLTREDYKQSYEDCFNALDGKPLMTVVEKFMCDLNEELYDICLCKYTNE